MEGWGPVDKSLVKALRLLEVVARSPEPRGVSSLARELDLTKSNVHRLLTTLTASGFLRRDAEHGTYGPSLKLWELGTLSVAGLDVRRVAAPVLARLAQDTGETANLAVLDGLEVVYLERVETSQAVRAFGRVGGRVPAHCVATGKVMLAHADAATVAAALERLERHTDRTITEPYAFAEELVRVRRQGYASSAGEWREGVRSMAAPIWGPGNGSAGAVVAAAGISAPAERLKPARIRDMAPIVMAAAAEITRRMGGHVPDTATAAMTT